VGGWEKKTPIAAAAAGEEAAATFPTLTLTADSQSVRRRKGRKNRGMFLVSKTLGT
jgi:hypothetical protein